jgi:cytidyltransferase-like protein
MRTVYVDMVADLFHAGHVHFLARAAALGDTLVVGIHDDETVHGYKRQPIIPHAERCDVVASCRHVDSVIPHAPIRVTAEFLREHGIDVVVHAHAEGDKVYEEMYRIPRELGMFQRLDYTPGVSTTAIIARIRQ